MVDMNFEEYIISPYPVINSNFWSTVQMDREKIKALAQSKTTKLFNF